MEWIKRIILILLGGVMPVPITGSEQIANTLHNTAVPYKLEDDVKVFLEDYPEKYADTLTAMFGSDCSISNASEGYRAGEHCDCGMDEHDSRYLQWTISYTDGDGARHLFLLKNDRPLYEQVETYLEGMVSDYFEANYFEEYTQNIAKASGGNYIFCFLDDMRYNADEVPEKCRAVEEYRRGLEKPDTCICFSELEMKDVFRTCPIYLSINIAVDADRTTDETAWNCAQDMVTAMLDFTSNTMNATLHVYSESQQTNSHNNKMEAYISGEKTAFHHEFERDVFDTYTGIFW